MHKLEVGKPYIPGKTWPDNIAEYNYYQNGHELRFFFSNLTEKEITTFTKNPIKLGLLVQQPVIFLIYQFENGVDGDAPYSIHLVPQEMRQPIPIPVKNERSLLQLHLIESTNGILKVIRVVTLSPDFSKRLHEAIIEQENLPFNKSVYDGTLRQAYFKYPDTLSMFKIADVVCMGGE